VVVGGVGVSTAGDFGTDDLGSLVMVRHRFEAGATDVVGELEAMTASTITIRRRDDSLVEVPRDSVLAAKLVGVSPLAARTLEGVAARGWPAPESAWLGQWWLRAAGGFTARANSVRPLGSPELPLDEALDFVAAWYRERGLPPKVQVVVGSSLDAELARRGWPADPEVRVQTVPIVQAVARLGVAPPPEATATISTAPSAGWLAAFRGGVASGGVASGGAASGDALAVLTGPPHVVFAEVGGLTVGGLTVGGVGAGGRDEGLDAALAIGRAALEGAWAGITAVEVASSHRRQGLARSVMRSLLAYADDVGVRQVYLEVLATNQPALELYAAMGFRDHHRYCCRTAPGSAQGTPC
jgi:ribosomal protein S18 acetylase RimI-like enzyme